MAEATENPVDPDLFNDLQAESEIQTEHVRVEPGLSFLQKCIHPPSAIPGFIGMPTNDSRSQVLLEYRNVYLHNPTYYWTDAEHVATYDKYPTEFVFLVTNGISKLAHCFFKNTQGNWLQDLNNTDDQMNYDFWNLANDAQLYRPVYKSLTTYLNATMFNNTGFVAVNQYTPPILFSGTLLEFSANDPTNFYEFMKTYAKYCKPATTESVAKFLKKFPSYVRTEIANLVPNFRGLSIDPDTLIQIVDFGASGETNGVPIPTLSQILQQSQRSYGGKALEGTFSVSRLTTIAPTWLTASNTHRGDFSHNGLYQCWIYFISGDHNIHFNPLFANTPLGLVKADDYIAYEALWSADMTWQWIYYSGLTYNTDIATPDINRQILIRKYYTGYEVQPTLKSAWSGMIKLGPKPDILLMQKLMDDFYSLKDGMPARFNALGELLKTAGTAAKGALQALFPGPAEAAAEAKEEKAEKKEAAKESRAMRPRQRSFVNSNNYHTFNAQYRGRPQKPMFNRPPSRRRSQSQRRPQSRQRSQSRNRSNSRNYRRPQRQYSNNRNRRPNYQRGRGRGRRY